jgi:hypothetical protein
MSFYKQINLLSINKIHKHNGDDVTGVVNHLKLRFKRFQHRKFYFDFSAILNLKNYEKHSIISKISIQFNILWSSLSILLCIMRSNENLG